MCKITTHSQWTFENCVWLFFFRTKILYTFFNQCEPLNVKILSGYNSYPSTSWFFTSSWKSSCSGFHWEILSSLISSSFSSLKPVWRAIMKISLLICEIKMWDSLISFNTFWPQLFPDAVHAFLGNLWSWLWYVIYCF